MEYNRLTDPRFGECLYVTNGSAELYIPLSYGIRIAHFSLPGGQNVFFEQPEDMVDLTRPNGWRIRGGHRLWISPEDDSVYYADNDPISWLAEGSTLTLTQPEDPWLQIVKSMQITFGEDASVQIVHRIRNMADVPRTCALWAISAMAPGGTEYIPLQLCDNGDTPSHWISLWNYTNLGDRRASYSREEICLTHMPDPEPYKIGVHLLNGPVRYENNGILFEKSFSASPELIYPDNNVSYETFLCEHMVEIESLSALTAVPPGESREHTEVWRLRKTV